MVIIKTEFVARGSWPLGKVVEVRPDARGVVRSVVLNTLKGRFLRPVHKLALVEGVD